MKKITPHLWFDKEAKEAAEFYTSLLPNSKVTHVSTIHDTPSGDCDIVSFELAGQPFMAISAGPIFKLNPSVSFHIKCTTAEEVDALWAKLSPGGKVLMPLDKYPFSERYGWVQDRFGVSWQIIHAGAGPITQRITPVLMFTGPVAGKAEEAVKLYTSIFKNSKYEVLMRYPKGAGPDKEGTVAYSHFFLNGQEFGAMDSAAPHEFNFNEAVSLLIPCESQEEVDYFWDKLTLGGDPASQQCGWLKDKYGVSWQVWPTEFGEMMENGTPEQIARLTQAFMKMKKFDIAKLREVYKK